MLALLLLLLLNKRANTRLSSSRLFFISVCVCVCVCVCFSVCERKKGKPLFANILLDSIAPPAVTPILVANAGYCC